MDKEPAAIVGTVTAVVSAVLVFLKAMGLDISDAQQDAIRGLVAVLAPVVAALVIRGFVVAPDTAEQKVAEGYRSGQVGGPMPSVKA